MNLGELVAFCGNLLDYDPVNDTYREQLVDLLNDVQARILTDRHWSFAQIDRQVQAYTDKTIAVGMTLNSPDVTSAALFDYSTSVIKPGSSLELGELEVTLASGEVQKYRVSWVESASLLHLDRNFEGPTGPYTATIRQRDVFLPVDTAAVMNVGDPTTGIPTKAIYLSRWERDDTNLDPSLLGTIEAYLPGEGLQVPAPRTSTGVATVAGVGQGVRTINVYQVNVRAPIGPSFSDYRKDASQGLESALSKVATYSLTALQTLEFTPETLDDRPGLYRRYYFTCPEAGLLAPVRIADAASSQDTVSPAGGVTLAPDLSLATLQTQAFAERALRYRGGGLYRSIELYPHPSADQLVNVRTLISPQRMYEDQDAPLVPSAYAQVIAYAALESLTLKVDNPALSAVYERKKDLLFRSMEQRYLEAVPRRLIKGMPTAGYRYIRNPFGPLTFTP